MKYKLFNEYNEDASIITTILTNRGIQEKDIHHYLNTTDNDIASPLCFGKDVLYKGVKTLFKSIYENTPCAMIVDADCDGMTSAALLSNYLYDLFPSWTYNNLTHLFHKGKKHGLNDMMDMLLNSDYDVIICPDSGRL